MPGRPPDGGVAGGSAAFLCVDLLDNAALIPTLGDGEPPPQEASSNLAVSNIRMGREDDASVFSTGFRVVRCRERVASIIHRTEGGEALNLIAR